MIEESKGVSWEIWEQQVMPTLASNPQEALTYLFQETLYDAEMIRENLAKLPEFDFIDLTNVKKEKHLNKIKKELVHHLSDFVDEEILSVLIKIDLPYQAYLHLLRLEKIKSLEVLFKILKEWNPFFLVLVEKYQFELDEKLSFSQKEESLSSFFFKVTNFLSKVEELSLCFGYLTSYPTPLDFFKTLKTVDLSCYSFIELPENFGDGWPLLEMCNLRNCGLKKLPGLFGKKWIHLKKLDLGNNKLRSLPLDFGKTWTRLEKINLSYNNLSSLRRDYGSDWESLKVIRLSQNKIKKIHLEFGKNWNRLLEAALGGNKVRTLRDNFGKNWTDVKSVQLQANKISFLPKDFGKYWPSQCVVELQDNRILELSLNQIENLKKLNKIYIDYNLLSKEQMQLFKNHPQNSSSFNQTGFF